MYQLWQLRSRKHFMLFVTCAAHYTLCHLSRVCYINYSCS